MKENEKMYAEGAEQKHVKVGEMAFVPINRSQLQTGPIAGEKWIFYTVELCFKEKDI